MKTVLSDYTEFTGKDGRLFRSPVPSPPPAFDICHKTATFIHRLAPVFNWQMGRANANLKSGERAAMN
jgi:hypothetical protein